MGRLIRFGILFLTLGGILTFVPSSGANPVLTDKAIGDAVQVVLKRDPKVPVEKVGISVTNGVVTLTGEVNNLLARERAVALAETVRGVRAVVGIIKVIPPFMLKDGEIRGHVEDALMEEPAEDSHKATVTVSGNVVTLTGTVNSWQEKRLAEEVAKGVKGVTGVNNLLAVRNDGNRPDTEVKADVERTLKWDTLVDHEAIGVEAKGGVVKLFGKVGSAAEKRRAVMDSYVTGVTSVDSTRLAVEDRAKDQSLRETGYVQKSDEEIRKALADALLIDPRVRSFSVYPEVSYGSVILHGEVSNFEARNAAEQDARHTVGVKDVENRLTVIPSMYVSDPKIEDQVRKALLGDPHVERLQIGVQVMDGIVKLYGTVDSPFEKRHAEEVASKVEGLVGIANDLLVNSKRSASQ
jgi:osmotically-inducible protein OsmY